VSDSLPINSHDGTSNEPKKRLRVWTAWTVAVLVVLYPLSMGPAFW
jgi:hypothetical protein